MRPRLTCRFWGFGKKEIHSFPMFGKHKDMNHKTPWGREFEQVGETESSRKFCKGFIFLPSFSTLITHFHPLIKKFLNTFPGLPNRWMETSWEFKFSMPIKKTKLNKVIGKICINYISWFLFVSCFVSVLFFLVN